jgi:iron complex outermembrane receptor protein
MRAAGCVPISVFGREVPSEAALAFIRNDTRYETKSTQDLVDLNIAGDIVELPAGPLQFAAGFEYRKETIKFRSNELSKSTYIGQGRSYWDAPGAEVNALWSGVVDDAPDADLKVYDYYAEILAPVLADLPAIHALDLEAAVRYSDYDSTPSTTTWRLAANWAPVESFRIRATRSKSVRAPNLFELYSIQSTVLSNLTDPCDNDAISGGPNRASNCAALGIPEGWDDPRAGVANNILLGGNPDLEPETSNSWTVGGIFDSALGEGRLRVALDYWNIDLDDVISETDATTIINNCVDAPSIDNSFCALVTRDALDYSILSVKSTKINLENLSSDGIDFELSYYHDVPGLLNGNEGGLTVGVNGTYLLSNEETAIPGDANTLDIRDGELGYPDWRINVRTDYTTGPLSLTWSLRYIASTVRDTTPPEAPPGYSSYYPAGFNDYGSVMYNDISARYWFGEHFELSAGINNVFDEEPPIAGKFYTHAARGGFDQIGRYYWIGLKFRY